MKNTYKKGQLNIDNSLNIPDNLYEQLLEYYQLDDSDKTKKLYELSWLYGNHCGQYQIKKYFEEMLVLLT